MTPYAVSHLISGEITENIAVVVRVRIFPYLLRPMAIVHLLLPVIFLPDLLESHSENVWLRIQQTQWPTAADFWISSI